MSNAEKAERIEKGARSGKSRRVSVWNWLGTLILLGIPGVNLIALILFLIFAKAQAKRSFCIAYLILALLSVILICAALLIFPQQLSDLAAYLRGAAGAPVPVVN